MSLKKIIKANGKSMCGVAKELGVSRQTIHNWNVGDASPTFRDMKALADKLGVSVVAIVKEMEELKND